MKKKIIIGLIVLFVAAQAIQPSKNKGNADGPNDITKTLSVPANVLSILKRSCYDCHSSKTTYPWYDNITPVNWWIAHHVNEGKEKLNFTSFGTYRKQHQFEKLDEIAETIKSDEMPLKSYLIMHTEAKLTDAEKKLIWDWSRTAMDQVNKLPTND